MFLFFAIGAVFCFFYYVVLNLYTGLKASGDFIWLLFCVILFGFAFISRIYKTDPKKIPLWLVVAINTLTIAGICVFLLLQTVIFLAASAKPEPQLDYIIVLGARIKEDGSLSKSLQSRVQTAKNYIVEYPATLIVLSGGRGRDEPVSEAEAMAQYLLLRGVEPESLFLEIQSSNTRENILYSKVLINRVIKENSKENIGDIGLDSGPVMIAENRPKRVGIITNGFHMFRALSLARSIGYRELYALVAPSDPVLYLHFSTRECIAILKDKFMGYY